MVRKNEACRGVCGRGKRNRARTASPEGCGREGPCWLGQEESSRVPSTLKRLDGIRRDAHSPGGAQPFFFPPESLVSFSRTPSKVPVVILHLHPKFRQDTERSSVCFLS